MLILFVLVFIGLVVAACSAVRKEIRERAGGTAHQNDPSPPNQTATTTAAPGERHLLPHAGRVGRLRVFH